MWYSMSFRPPLLAGLDQSSWMEVWLEVSRRSRGLVGRRVHPSAWVSSLALAYPSMHSQLVAPDRNVIEFGGHFRQDSLPSPLLYD